MQRVIIKHYMELWESCGRVRANTERKEAVLHTARSDCGALPLHSEKGGSWQSAPLLSGMVCLCSPALHSAGLIITSLPQASHLSRHNGTCLVVISGPLLTLPTLVTPF